MSLMETFPDDESIERLKELGVRYVLVHQAFYRPADYADLMDQVSRRARVDPERALPGLGRRGYADYSKLEGRS